jgi:PAS domain S-box-containing protein
MSWVEALAEPHDLHRCIRDLVALSTMPAIWRNNEPQQMADSVSAALLAMLDADFVYLALPAWAEGSPIEVIRTGRSIAAGFAESIRANLCSASFDGQSETLANPAGAEPFRIAVASIGPSPSMRLVAGSCHDDFPTEMQRLLFGIAASKFTFALQKWHLDRDERRFATLVERSPDFIGFADLHGRPKYLNLAGRELVGLSDLQEAPATHILDFVAPEDRGRAYEECWPQVLRNGVWSGELAFWNFKAGLSIPFSVNWFRIDHPRTGRPMNIATISRELTAQKRSEAKLRHLNEVLEHIVSERTAELADTSKKLVFERERTDARLQELQLELLHSARLSAAGQLAAELAHELNQPLTAAANSIHAARRLLTKKEFRLEMVKEIMDEAAEQAVRAGQIIRRLREFLARGETEKQAEPLTTLIEEAGSLALTGTGALGLKLRYQFDPRASKVVANRIQIQQVLVNLMRNALEAMADSERRELDVTTGLRDENNVEIVVADSGPGFSPQVADHLFEPFVSTKRDGMGLGLSICRSIVEAHGGKLEARPNRGGGAMFRFTLVRAD